MCQGMGDQINLGQVDTSLNSLSHLALSLISRSLARSLSCSLCLSQALASTRSLARSLARYLSLAFRVRRKREYFHTTHLLLFSKSEPPTPSTYFAARTRVGLITRHSRNSPILLPPPVSGPLPHPLPPGFLAPQNHREPAAAPGRNRRSL
jgi:hypothetical protein